jgi:hypothetical protein
MSILFDFVSVLNYPMSVFLWLDVGPHCVFFLWILVRAIMSIFLTSDHWKNDTMNWGRYIFGQWLSCNSVSTMRLHKDFVIWEVLFRQCPAWNIFSILRGSRLVSNLTLVVSLNLRIWSEIPAVIYLPCFWATLEGHLCEGRLAGRFSCGRRCWGFFYCFVDPIWGGNCGAEYFGVGQATASCARRDISALILKKDCAGCKVAACCFV